MIDVASEVAYCFQAQICNQGDFMGWRGEVKTSFCSGRMLSEGPVQIGCGGVERGEKV